MTIRMAGSANRRSIPRSRTRNNAGIIAGTCILTLLLLAGLLLPLPFNPVQPDAGATLQPPSREHWFGTDPSGFDVFSRTIAAAALDLPLAAAGVLVSMFLGVPSGLLASGRGRTAEGFMRALDTFQAFPLLVLAIVVVAMTGNDLRNVVVAIILITTPQFIRLVRGQALALREARFIEAAKAVGVSPFRIVWRHLLPNVSEAVFAQLSLGAAHALMVIAALSYLGVGISPPDASWGIMIRAGTQGMVVGQWWTSVFPGLAILMAVVSFNAVADGLLAKIDGSKR